MIFRFLFLTVGMVPFKGERHGQREHANQVVLHFEHLEQFIHLVHPPWPTPSFKN
jgi:hypothetical protein